MLNNFNWHKFQIEIGKISLQPTSSSNNNTEQKRQQQQDPINLISFYCQKRKCDDSQLDSAMYSISNGS